MSKPSFMVSASLEESRISTPMAEVIYASSRKRVRVWMKGALGESGAGEEGGRTSFSILTLALMPSSWASFWFSSSERTASLYWPLAQRWVWLAMRFLVLGWLFLGSSGFVWGMAFGCLVFLRSCSCSAAM